MTGIDEAGGTMISRREAFRVGGALLAAKVLSAALPARMARGWLGWLAPRPAGAQTLTAQTSTAGLTLAEFSPHVGSRFDIRIGRSGRVTTTLTDARPRRPGPLDRRGLTGESFSLVLAGEGSRAFQHGTYTVEHPSMGSFPLFLVAVGAGTNGPRYEAIIDRRVPRG